MLRNQLSNHQVRQLLQPVLRAGAGYRHARAPNRRAWPDPSSFPAVAVASPLDSVKCQPEDRRRREVRVGRRIDDLHFDVAAVRTAGAALDESHCGLAVLGAPAHVGAGPVTGPHPQTGHDRSAQNALRLRQPAQHPRHRALPRRGHAGGSGSVGEQRSVRVCVSEKCWCAPDPTLPANGAGDRLTRSPWRRAARPMMSRVSTSWSAAATGG